MENLFDDIPESNKQQWITQVTKDLKGADFNEKLIHTVAGIEIQPLYTKDDIPEYVHDTADDFFAELDPEFSDGGTDDLPAVLHGIFVRILPCMKMKY